MKKFILSFLLFILSCAAFAATLPYDGKFRPELDTSLPDSFFGVEITGEKVCLILDHSGSMSANSRYELLSQQVDSIIDFFHAKAKSKEFKNREITLMMIPFDNNVQEYPSRPIPMKSVNAVQRAKKEFRKHLMPSGGTNFIKAWQKALTILPRYKFDTVYFLTDGYADNPMEIIKKFKADKRNAKYSNFEIKCIAIGTQSPVMEEMAREIPATSYTYVPDLPSDAMIPPPNNSNQKMKSGGSPLKQRNTRQRP